MLKEYFTLDEAAARLSTVAEQLGRRDVLDLAMRGKLRMVFWFEGELHRFRCVIGGGYADPCEEDSEAWHVSTKGYFLVPEFHITPESDEFAIDNVQPVEKPAWSSRPWRTNANGYVLGACSGDREPRHELIRITIDLTYIPISDVEALSAKMPAGPVEEVGRESTLVAGTGHQQKNVRHDPDTNRLVGWQRALLECWPEIANAFKPNPSGRDVMRWLKKKGPTDVIPREQPNSDSMQWLGLDGAVHTISLSSIRNRISEFRKAGKLEV